MPAAQQRQEVEQDEAGQLEEEEGATDAAALDRSAVRWRTLDPARGAARAIAARNDDATGITVTTPLIGATAGHAVAIWRRERSMMTRQAEVRVEQSERVDARVEEKKLRMSCREWRIRVSRTEQTGRGE